MKSYLLLLKMNLKSMLGNFHGASLRRDSGKLDVSRIFLYVAASIGIAVLAGTIIFLEVTLYQTAAGLNENVMLSGLSLPKMLIGLALLLSMVVTLIFGIFHTLGAMYFNRDTAAMAYLPITSRTHMAAKWSEIYLIEIFFAVALLLPMLICHGVAQHAGIGYYFLAAVTLLTSPLYPLAICLLLSAILGRITALVRNKELWVVLGTILLLVIVLGSEWMLMPAMPEDADEAFIISLLMENEGLLNFLVSAVPPVMWALTGLGGDWVYTGLFALVGAGAITAVIWITGGSYLSVCLSHTEQGQKKRRVRGKAAEASFAPLSPFRAVLKREMNEILKTPVYLLNAVFGVLMMPIMLIAASVGATASEEGLILSVLIDQLLSAVSPMDLILIMAGLFSIMTLISPISSTVISREGKRLQLMCMIPVPPRVIIRAKLLTGLVFILIGAALIGTAIVVLLGAAYLPHVMAAIVLAMLLAYAVSAVSLTVDVVRPVLEWKNETQVMKQNMNTMIGMLVSIVLIAVAAVPPFLMLTAPAWARLLTVCLIVLAEAGGTTLLLRKFTEQRFAALEP